MNRDLQQAFETLGDRLEELLHAQVDQINGALTQSIKGVRTQGANRVSFALAAGQSDGNARPTHAGGVLLGWSIRETTGAAVAQVIFRDGGSTGEEIASANLNAGESTRDVFPFGISLIDDLYLDVTSGAIAGAVYLGVR